MELGKRLKELRLESHLSLRDAAAKIGISHTYLATLEKGYDTRTGAEITPSESVLLKVCRAYGIDAADVIPTVDLRHEEDLYVFVAGRINRLKKTDPRLYAHLLDIIVRDEETP